MQLSCMHVEKIVRHCTWGSRAGDRQRARKEGTSVEVRDMGVSTAKQYQAAVALLQRFQQTILHGDMVAVAITRGACAKLALAHTRKSENARRQASLVDAAASK